MQHDLFVLFFSLNGIAADGPVGGCCLGWNCGVSVSKSKKHAHGISTAQYNRKSNERFGDSRGLSSNLAIAVQISPATGN